MMGHRTKFKSMEELDAFTGWRRVSKWRAGQVKAIKRKFNKRVRRENRMLVRNDCEFEMEREEAMLDDLWDEWDEEVCY